MASSPHLEVEVRSPEGGQGCCKEADVEEQNVTETTPSPEKKTSAFKSLGWLDRFLAVWILLAMVIGVLLGNFVPETGPALQKGKFAGVSIPIGKCPLFMTSISSRILISEDSSY